MNNRPDLIDPFSVEQYCNALEEYISQLTSRVADRYGLDPDSEADEIAELTEAIELIYATQFRFSLVLAVISAAESNLEKTILKARGLVFSSPISHRDIRGGALERARLWLETFAGFQKPSEQQWRMIHALRELRNLIAHAGGNIAFASDKNKVIAAISEVPGARIEGDLIVLSEESTSHAVQVLSTICDELAEQLEALAARRASWSTHDG